MRRLLQRLRRAAEAALPVAPTVAAAALAAALCLAVPALVASAQEEGAAPPPEGEAAGEPGGEAEAPDIDEILQGEEEILSGGGYTYDPGDRRDPFRSLLESRTIERRGPRPDGIPGLIIDEITITGIFETPRGHVAQVRSSDKGKSFLLKEGDELYDGDVVSIGSNEVVFSQVVQDPTALKPFQEVVKKLNP